MKLKIIPILCAAVLLTTTTVHANTTINETDLVSNSKSVDITVTAHINSAFTVSLPATVELTKSDSNYTYSGFVGAKGDILATDALRVSPGKNVTLYDVTNRPESDTTLGGEGYNHKDPVAATISQPITIWKMSELSNEYNNKTISITAPDLQSGKWEGALNFNIRYIKNYVSVDATNASGENINAYASAITGTKKDQLLSSLVESGAVESANAVDQLIEVKSDDFEGLANTTFDLTGIATEGEKVAILHLNHNNEWELVSIETVGAENKVSGDFSSYSPVAFVKVNENGSFDVIPKAAGLYDARDNLLVTWEESGINVSTDYTYSSHITEKASPNYILTTNYPTATKVVIPDSVTRIGDFAFSDCTSLTSVTIPGSVTSICDNAFQGCEGLMSVNIQDGVTSIDADAFRDCSRLTSVTIPNSVTTMGRAVLRGCSGLTSVTISNNVTLIVDDVFYGCSSLTSVTIPGSVTSIGDNAFYDCSGLTSVTIPGSVTSIGNYVFDCCSSLTSVTIPDSVTSIGTGAFKNCSGLTEILVAENNMNYKSIDGVLFNKDATTLIRCPGGKSDDYQIPNSVTSINVYAFDGCSSLTSVTIPDSVTSIGNYVFNNCSSLASVTMPNSVTSIGDYAFYGCSSLTSVTIPDSVTSIGRNAFYKCAGLTSVTIPGSVKSIGQQAFYDCRSLTSVTIPEGVTNIGEEAFSNCRSLTSVTIPGSVTSIGNYVFDGCSSLTSVTILGSVTSIGTSAFRRCSSLTSVTIPDSVTSIGGSAFYECTGLASLTIPDSITSIGYRAFYNVPHIYYNGSATGSPWGAKAIN